MKKKIIYIFIIIVTIIVATLLGYKYLKNTQNNIAEPTIHLIPNDAAVILRINDYQSFIKHIKNNEVYQEITKLKPLYNFYTSFEKYYDSIIFTEIFSNKKKQELFISLHNISTSKTGFLACIPISEKNQNYLTTSTLKTTRNYKDNAFYSLHKSKEKLHVLILNQNLCISNSELLLEQIVNQNKTNLLNNDSFKELYATLNPNISVNILLNYKYIPPLIMPYFSNDFSQNINQLSKFAQYSAFDIQFKPQTIVLNGFSTATDSLQQYLSKLNKPHTFMFRKKSPDETILFVQKYNENIENQYEINTFKGIGFSAIDSSYYSFSISKILDSTQIINQYATGQTEKTLDISGDSIHIFKIKAEKEKSSLLQIIPYNTIPFGSIIGNYLYIASSIDALKQLLYKAKKQINIKRNISYMRFCDKIFSQSNYVFYANNIFQLEQKNIFNPAAYEQLPEIKHLAVQFVKQDPNLIYSNIYIENDTIKHELPIAKKGLMQTYFVDLEDSITTKPAFVTNHYTAEKDIIVQDNSNILYFINNNGKILWKKQLDAQLLGKIHEIDFYKNGKIQFLFNTQNTLYLFDRNGKHVENYPIKLKRKATAGVSVIDYNNNLDYRLILPLEDNKIYNLDITGNRIDGWSVFLANAKIIRPIKYYRIKTKDYLMAIDQFGETYILNRRGEIRIPTNTKTPISDLSEISFVEQKDANSSYICFAGNNGFIYQIFFNGAIDSISINNKKCTSPTAFIAADINKDGLSDFVYTSGDSLFVMQQDKSFLYTYRITTGKITRLNAYDFDDEQKIGCYNSASQNMYLINSTGVLESNFPISANTLSTIGDITNNQELTIIIGYKNKLYFYKYM